MFETITTFEEYQREALKTASMGKGRVVEGFVRVCGLVGEAAELYAELNQPGPGLVAEHKIMKELGDVLWYAATLSEWLNVGVSGTFEAFQDVALRQTSGSVFEAPFTTLILVRAGKLAELMKKHLGHDKPMADFKGRELELMQDVLVAIAHVANTVGLDLAKVAAVNINKLRARHGGGGFTAAAQNAKADEHNCPENGGCNPPTAPADLS